MAILGAIFFPFMLSFVSFYMTLGVQPLVPYMSCVFLEGKDFFPYPFSALIRFSILGFFPCNVQPFK